MEKRIFDILRDNLKNSYSPYSDYPVSAVVVTKDDEIFTGVNIENASYGATVCAERTAIFKAVSAGKRKGDLTALYVMVGSGKVGMPCFMCRQVISEFFDKEAHVVCFSTEGQREEYKVGELCPYPFTGEDLF
ncbi:MAG: cytidine deaminase [Saccharofermentans sp.]|nr:cytidine deaminase [Saccharofermentans sp.]